MKKLKCDITAATVRELLDYDPETGLFTWRHRDRRWFKTLRDCNAWNTQFSGTVAGCRAADNRTVMTVLGRLYYAHRLAWLHYYGAWPIHDLDHIDGRPANNAVRNLREAHSGINSQNLKHANKNNKTGLLGVSPHKHTGRFRASIKFGGENIYLGIFNTPEDAHATYLSAKRKHHPGYVPEKMQ